MCFKNLVFDNVSLIMYAEIWCFDLKNRQEGGINVISKTSF